MQGKLAAFAHEAAQYCTIWQPYFGSAASEPGFTSGYLKPGNSGAGISQRPRLDASGSLRVLGTKTRFATLKKLGAAALAADWPIELRFQRKPAALAALQDPHHSIVATLRVAHRCERVNFISASLRGVATAARAAQ